MIQYTQLQAVGWHKDSITPAQDKINFVLESSLERTKIQDRSNIIIWQPHNEKDCEWHDWNRDIGVNFDWDSFKENQPKSIWWLIKPHDNDAITESFTAETKRYISADFIHEFEKISKNNLPEEKFTNHFKKFFFEAYRPMLRKAISGIYMQIQDVKQNFIDNGYFVSLNNKIFINAESFNNNFQQYFNNDVIPVCMMTLGTRPNIIKTSKKADKILYSLNKAKLEFESNLVENQLADYFWWDHNKQELGNELSHTEKKLYLNY